MGNKKSDKDTKIKQVACCSDPNCNICKGTGVRTVKKNT